MISKSQKLMCRREFDRLDPIEKAAKMKTGYLLFDEVPAKKAPVVPGPNQMLREDFDKLSAKEKASLMKSGITLLDS